MITMKLFEMSLLFLIYYSENIRGHIFFINNNKRNIKYLKTEYYHEILTNAYLIININNKEFKIFEKKRKSKSYLWEKKFIKYLK